MKIVAAIVAVVFMVALWQVVGLITPDAVAMAVGFLFGTLAGIPTALLMLADGRRQGTEHDSYWRDRQTPPPPPAPTITVQPQNTFMLPSVDLYTVLEEGGTLQMRNGIIVHTDREGMRSPVYALQRNDR